MRPFPFIAVDVGNARTKLGWFPVDGGDALPEPQRTLQLDDAAELARLGGWLEGAEAAAAQAELAWWIGSVNRPMAARLVDWLREHRPHDPVTLLAADDLALVVRLQRPDMVGVDRLINAVAANRIRRPDRAAVVIDVGTAITVDLVSADGAFLGGAIVPGIGMSARAFHQFTDLLPLIEMAELATPPPALGTSTVPAMRSGLFWGAVGAIRELIAQLSRGLDAEPDVLLSGGAAPTVAELLGRSAQHVPHLTLAGIALTALARDTHDAAAEDT